MSQINRLRKRSSSGTKWAKKWVSKPLFLHKGDGNRNQRFVTDTERSQKYLFLLSVSDAKRLNLVSVGHAAIAPEPPEPLVPQGTIFISVSSAYATTRLELWASFSQNKRKLAQNLTNATQASIVYNGANKNMQCWNFQLNILYTKCKIQVNLSFGHGHQT